jgi:glycine dehydrogenase subunit 1
MSEREVTEHLNQILKHNVSSGEMPSFLGGGTWHHYVPAVVDEIVRRGEFLTSYTPYQAEISQGILQALFEYQSMICDLTGMDYANSSMYDWATALAEAARMAFRVTGRKEFLVPRYIHPERLATLQTISAPADIRIVQFNQDMRTGQVNMADVESKVSEKTAAIYLEVPSYLGFLETRPDKISDICHRVGALFVVGVNPIALGILKPPSDYGADIVIGEGQPLGNHMNFGGPLLGIFACKGEKLLRQMPGRIIGMTTTKSGAERAFCMVLQTREQHIRRGKATSNICTNEALCAVATAAYLSLLGPSGLRELGMMIVMNSQYAMYELNRIRGIKAPYFEAPHFNEFTVNFDGSNRKYADIYAQLLKQGIQGGKSIVSEFPELGETSLFCITELHSRGLIARLADSLRRIIEGEA